MTHARCFSLPLAALLLAPLALAPSALSADSPAPAGVAPPAGALESWMPEEIIGFAKLTGAGARLDQFLRSDLRRDLESMGPVKQLLAHEKWQDFQAKLREFKKLSGKDPLQLFRDLFGHEVVVGLRLGFHPEVLLLTRAAGEKELEDGLGTVREAVQKRLGYLPEPQRAKYAEREIETYDQVSFLRLGAVLAVSNSTRFLEQVADLAAGKTKTSVRASAVFGKAGGGKDSLVSFSARTQHIPNFRLPEKAENPLGSLLLSGLHGALEKSELLSGALRVRDGGVDLEVSSALAQGGLAEKYRSFFPEVAQDGLAARLEKRGLLALVQLHRGLAQWWEKREDLMATRAAGDLLNFSQVMSIIFQGRSFQDEVLPEFGPTITLVARNQEYKGLPGRPAPAIPGFAAVFELKSAEEFGTSLITGFQTLVGIINADRAQKKKEMGMAMLLRSEKVGEVDVHTVSLNLPKNVKLGIEHNFTPSLAIVGSRVVLSSSKELALVLVEEISALAAPAAAPARRADRVAVDAEGVRAILEQNRELLIAQSMMAKGKGKEAAEGEIDAIFEALKRLRGLELESKIDGEAVKLKLSLDTRLGGAEARPPERQPEKQPVEKPAAKPEGKKASL